MAKPRVATVDWKEHPIEVMAWLDRLAGKTWTKDPKRWDVTEAIDLDGAIPQKFLPIAAGAMAKADLAIVQVPKDSDEIRFAVVAAKGAAAHARTLKGTLIAPKTPAASRTKAKNGSKVEAEATKELAELRERIAALPIQDGAVLREFTILYVARLLLAAARVGEAFALFDFAVTHTLDDLEGMRFRQHGPHIESELVGAALLVGRGHELVRGLAHFLSLGERSSTMRMIDVELVAAAAQSSL